MEEIKLLENAYRLYNLDNRDDISIKVLNYISTRLLANRSSFEQMIEMLNLTISFKDILHAFNVAYIEQDYYKIANNYTQGVDYYSGVYPVSIGNIVVETNDVLEVVKYFVRGIKSRNTITISQTEYEELSLSNMLLIVFAEALAKFNISRNTLMIMPFEDCFYDEYDEVIILENGNIDVKQKEFSEMYIVYNHDNFFNDEITEEEKRLDENNILYQKVTGDLEKVLDTISEYKPKGVSIYTKDSAVAYKFVNLANSQNVFVNSSLLNSENLNNKKNTFYYKKKIMYPSGKVFNFDEYVKEYLGKANSKAENDTNSNSSSTSNMYLVEVVNPGINEYLKKLKVYFSK